MNDTLRLCLDDLEERIDPAEEQHLLDEWIAFSKGHFKGDLFSPSRQRPAPPRVEWPRVGVNAAASDHDLMLLSQYAACSQRLERADGLLLDVRANYGASILPLLFGVEPFLMPDEMDTLPTSRPLGHASEIVRLIAAGVPTDLDAGHGARVFQTTERYLEIASEYPKIARHVHLFHPDLQGPLDVCELVWGSGLFLAFYDQPALVADALDLMTETYIAFMRRWRRLVPSRPEGAAHWGLFHPGAVMIRNDSAMNISGALYEEFVQPRDQRILDTFGGGAIHFCGRGDHYVPALGEMRGLRAINLSQPEYNNMETIFRHTIDRDILIVGLPRQAAADAQTRRRDLRGRVHCSETPDYGAGSVAPGPRG